jgi:hypothetical protein
VAPGTTVLTDALRFLTTPPAPNRVLAARQEQEGRIELRWSKKGIRGLPKAETRCAKDALRGILENTVQASSKARLDPALLSVKRTLGQELDSASSGLKAAVVRRVAVEMAESIHRAEFSEPASPPPAIDSREMPLAVYLAARALVTREPLEAEAIAELREAQRTLIEARAALPIGREGVDRDLVKAKLEAAAIVSTTRWLSKQLYDSVRHPDKESLAFYGSCVPRDLIDQFQRCANTPLCAEQLGYLVDRTCHIAAARYGKAGFPEELALVAAALELEKGHRPYILTVKTPFGHSWIENWQPDLEAATREIIIDPSLNGPVVFRKDARFAASGDVEQIAIERFDFHLIAKAAAQMLTALRANPLIGQAFDERLKKERQHLIGDTASSYYASMPAVSDTFIHRVAAANETPSVRPALDAVAVEVNRAFGLNVKAATNKRNVSSIVEGVKALGTIQKQGAIDPADH